MKWLFFKTMALFLALLVVSCSKTDKIPDVFDGTVYLENGSRIEMIKVLPGTYMIGLPPEDVFTAADTFLREVVITRPFWLGKFEITLEQWDAVMGEHEKYKGNGILFVDWEKCAFANATRSNTADFIDRINVLYAEKLPDGYRFDLPSEEQWEIACRAGTTTRYPWGDKVESGKAAMVAFPDIEQSGTIRTIWKFLMAYRQTRSDTLKSRLSLKVGRYPANNWGFYDMIGNVSELCQFDPSIPHPASDPAPSENLNGTFVRGGDWTDVMSVFSSSRRKWVQYLSTTATTEGILEQPVIGFRLALVPNPSSLTESGTKQYPLSGQTHLQQ